MMTLENPATVNSTTMWLLVFGLPMLALAVKCGAVGALIRFAFSRAVRS